jgi:hypothetical protein
MPLLVVLIAMGIGLPTVRSAIDTNTTLAHDMQHISVAVSARNM